MRQLKRLTNLLSSQPLALKQKIKLRSGKELDRSIASYDSTRPQLKKHDLFRERGLRSICYAPFLSMDFDATGAIRLCNHSSLPLAHVSEDISVIDVWRGELYRQYRKEMSNYVLDDTNCRHCIRQCETGTGAHVFAKEQFDIWAKDEAEPPYPDVLIFRLNNTCNLACVMCDGLTSSRIRKERDHLPLVPSKYGDRFFRDMKEILPHVRHIEFYGGEPFLVREHIRIFEILTEVNAKCTIYVNTNGVSLYPKARGFLETLNFQTIAISMDAVSDELHSEIRYGLRSDLFHRNLDYFLDLRARRGISVMLNVTEHRKNWFELPEIFRFAEKRRLPLHINTCIHPDNITLYTLPDSELCYVLTFLERQREELLAEYPRLSNLSAYDFLLDLIRRELNSREPGWQPVIVNRNEASDGFLGTPLAGLVPFETADKVLSEARRIVRTIGGETAARMLKDMLARVQTLRNAAAWSSVSDQLQDLIASLQPSRSQDKTVFRSRKRSSVNHAVAKVSTRMDDLVKVSIITPANNAGRTIAETLRSVQAQTYSGWEQIVVDDGSSDNTGAVVRSFMQQDQRISLITQSQLGEAAARNAGLRHARYDWLLFLDADDWILPEYFETMLGRLSLEPWADAIICRSARVASDATVCTEDEVLPEGDLFPVLARYPPFHIHACVIRKAFVDAVGHFDTSLERCPDWDLWQKVARAGCRFTVLDEVLAYYRMSPTGISLDADKMLRDSLTILRRGHGPDNRVENPDPRFAEGMPPDQIVTQEFYLLSWCAGLLLGAGKDARPLLEMVKEDCFPELWPPSVADCLLDAAVLPAGKAPQHRQQLVPLLMENLDSFLSALEEQTGAPELAGRTRDELQKKINLPSVAAKDLDCLAASGCEGM